MASLHDLHRALFPTARPLGASRALPRPRRAGGRLGPRPEAARPGFRGARDRRPGDHPGCGTRRRGAPAGPDRGSRRGPRPGACPGRAPGRWRDRERRPGGPGRGGHRGRADRPAPGPDGSRSPWSEASSGSSSIAGPSWTVAPPTSSPSWPGSRCWAAASTCRPPRSARSWAVPSSSRDAVATRSRSMPPPTSRPPPPRSRAIWRSHRAAPRCASRSRRLPASPARVAAWCSSATNRPTSSSGSPRTGSWPCSHWNSPRDAAVRQARDETRRGEPLPADGPPWVVMLASQGAAAGPDDIAAREETRGELRLLMSPRRLVLRGSSESLELRLVAAAPADDPAGLATAERLAAFLDRTIAVSRPFTEPERPPRGRGRRPGDPRGRGPARRSRRPWPARRACRPISCSVASATCPTGHARHASCSTRSSSAGPRSSGSASTRCGAVLGSPSLNEAATRLGVHRNTVAYRIARLEELADWDLADPDLRFALELAVRVVQNAQD